MAWLCTTSGCSGALTANLVRVRVRVRVRLRVRVRVRVRVTEAWT